MRDLTADGRDRIDYTVTISYINKSLQIAFDFNYASVLSDTCAALT